jgi:hypothetical protein
MVLINTDYITSPTSSFLTVAEWIDEYGPLITIRSGTEKMVVIGRHKVNLFTIACFISKLQHFVAGRGGYYGEAGRNAS